MASPFTPSSVGSAVDIRGVRLTDPTAFRLQARGSAYAVGVDDVDGIGWFATSGLFTSTDNIALTSHALPADVSSGSQVARVVRFGASVYCYAVNDGGAARVYRSQPPSAGTVAWTAVKTTAGTGVLGQALDFSLWSDAGNYLFAAEYADPPGGPQVWRSSDGTTWASVLGPVSGLRHFHAVACDPYAPGHVYLTAGDGNGKVLYRSTDSGATWTLLVTNNRWQAVQISFSPEWVWFAGDDQSVTVWVADRSTPFTPLVASSNHHRNIAVPGGGGGRGPFSDGVLTGSSATFTSATAAFTSADVGRFVRFDAGQGPAISNDNGVWITAVANATTVTLNKTAGGNQTARRFWIDGDTFYRTALSGCVDPDTGIYYCIAADSTSGGTRCGLFYLPRVGSRIELLEPYQSDTPGQVFLRNGRLWAHQANRALLTLG